MAGQATAELAAAAEAGGADLIEIGFPFSDPLADGPVIRRAAEQALAEGMRTAECLQCLRDVHERVSVPLVPMTYSSLLEAYGWERFDADAREAGASSLIVADLPVDVHPELPRIQLVAPTSTDERISLAAAETDGWLYLVTVAGTTGARAELSPALAPLVERTRALTDVPLYAGFGISTPEQAAAAGELADGVVVGSAALLAAEEGPASARGLRRSAARRARLSEQPVPRDVPCLRAGVDVLVVAGPGEDDELARVSGGARRRGVARRDAQGHGVVAVAVQHELRNAER